MGFWDKLKGEFIDIIEWLDESDNTIVYKFERYGNEIKYGAKLIVRESQTAIFVNEGKIADIFKPGTYTLETKNMPIMTTLNNWAHGFKSPFKAEVYFVSNKIFSNLKWGTKNPIILRDPEFGPIRIRAFGTFSIRVKDPVSVVRSVSGTSSQFTVQSIHDNLRNFAISRFTDAVSTSRIPILDLAASYDELGNFIKSKISPDFEEFGFEVVSFVVENVSLPEEVEKVLDKRTSMGIIGNLNSYTQFQVSESMTKNNLSSPISDILSLGVGLSMSNQLVNNLSSKQIPPPIKQDSYYIYLNNQKEGPLNLNQVIDLIKSNKVNNDTLIWKNGLLEWVKISSLTEFKNLVNENIPTLPPPPPLQIEEKKYFIYLDNNKVGPLTKQDIINLADNKRINNKTLVWFSNLTDWKTISEIEELKNIIKDDNILPPPIKNKIVKDIIKGQKLTIDIEIGSNKFLFGANWNNSECQDYDIDLSVLLLGKNKKLQKEEDFIFYNNKEDKNRSIKLVENFDLPYKKLADINLENISTDIYSLLFVLTIFDGIKNNQKFENVKELYFDVFSNENILRHSIKDLKDETAIILAEIYKKNQEWKIQAIGEGYKLGLDSIIKEYAGANINL
ncbi:MAG: hypothetical protein KatS3mg068_2034 [Candidatus Sericytochromatia bacterium]|nr:MAG: hypothetical protein KatS3mg068_2034 [Candidatus Sericytochromatia bacterium]